MVSRATGYYTVPLIFSRSGWLNPRNVSHEDAIVSSETRVECPRAPSIPLASSLNDTIDINLKDPFCMDRIVASKCRKTIRTT